MVRIWFNHWFSTAYNIIRLIRREIPNAWILGTNEHADCVLSLVSDEWGTEPVLHGDEYVSFCLDYCREHSVDVFIPRREMLAVSRRKADFEALGVKVMVDDYDLVSVLNHKDKAYRYFSEKGISTLPAYRIVRNVEDFRLAYLELKEDFQEICIKFVHDEGGKSFRLIDNSRKGYAALFKKQNTRMTFTDIEEALSEREEFAPLMVMPYLPGAEISADCLNTEQGLIMLPRIKDATRVERMSFDPEILRITREVFEAAPLACPCNIQFKNLKGVPYLLEVNTRMSGGIQMACESTGVNIPGLAVRKLLGHKVSWEICTEERKVSHVEIPVVLP